MPTKLDDNGARSHRFHVKLVGLCENSFNRKKSGEKSCIGIRSEKKGDRDDQFIYQPGIGWSHIHIIPLLFVPISPTSALQSYVKGCASLVQGSRDPLSVHSASFPSVNTGYQVIVCSKEAFDISVYIQLAFFVLNFELPSFIFLGFSDASLTYIQAGCSIEHSKKESKFSGYYILFNVQLEQAWQHHIS